MLNERRLNVCFVSICGYANVWADRVKALRMMSSLRAFLSDTIAQYVIRRYRPGGLALPVLRIRGKSRAMNRREQLQNALTQREKEWGFGYYLEKQ